VHERSAAVTRPEKELRRFAKVDLQPGSEETVSFRLGYRDFAYWDAPVHDWQVHTGDFDLLAGGSSADLPLHTAVHVVATRVKYPALTRYSTLNELARHPRGKAVYDHLMEQMAAAFVPAGADDAARRKAVATIEGFLGDTPICKVINFTNGKFTEAQLRQILQEVNQ